MCHQMYSDGERSPHGVAGEVLEGRGLGRLGGVQENLGITGKRELLAGGEPSGGVRKPCPGVPLGQVSGRNLSADEQVSSR